MMTAKVVMFPLASRVTFVRKHAARRLQLSSHGADHCLMNLLHSQEATMRRRGISADIIMRELESLKAAILKEAGRQMIGEGRAQ